MSPRPTEPKCRPAFERISGRYGATTSAATIPSGSGFELSAGKRRPDAAPVIRGQVTGMNGAVRHSPCRSGMLDRRSDSAGSCGRRLSLWHARDAWVMELFQLV
jgi:hypothetical protein